MYCPPNAYGIDRVMNASGAPGAAGSNTARTQYSSVGGGHRQLPQHVRAAARAAEALNRTIDDQPFDPARGDEQYMSRKSGAMAHAILREVMHSPTTAGPLGDNIVLQPAAASLLANLSGGA